ncbi:dipeptide ABC transporter ATP-binding protein [Acidisoma silvae]|uniref:ABC transporter ATP-binding protein n=1 Tax=Acidisoma silvae TaxID=2802396 RepID=A0A963YUX8_9PROT|nr:ABC transporter ATP-binding protein [Acidisoma silvae]MCB8877498.1 ABC transporter ATP-binding protein [Acidisoma silvae]
MSGADTLAHVENLTVRFQRPHPRTVLRDISFTLQAGRILAIVGESGSGKSVTGRSLLGLAGAGAVVTAQRLEIVGQPVLGLSQRAWRRLRGKEIGLVLQDAMVSLDPLRPVAAEIGEVLAVHDIGSRGTRPARVIEALTEAGVPRPEERARQRSGELSGGLRQRALVAAAIAARPRILIADEPTTALDPTVQRQILDLLRTMAERGDAVLLITHDMGVVSAVADDVLVLKDGHVIEQGPAQDILRTPRHAYTRSLLAAVPGHRSGPSRIAETSDETPALAVSGLTKHYPRPDGAPVAVVQDISFTLRQGRTLGLVGESGAGKSTVGRMLLGMTEPDAGAVRLLGDPWSGIAEPLRRSRRAAIQMIYQDPLSSFDPRLTVRDILLDALHAAGLRDKPAALRRAGELLAQVGLPERIIPQSPRILSGGQRQRVAIARAIATNPRVLICDEPVSALDVITQAQVLELLDSLQKRLNLSMVFISHDLGVIGQVSDDIMVLRDGQVVEHGAADAIITAPKHPYTRQLFEAALHLPKAA